MSKRRQFLRNIAIASISLSSAASIARSTGRKITSPDVLECEETTLDLYGEGPFYTENPPAMDNNILVGKAEPGERMIISGRVFNLDCTEYIPETLIDVWHADDAGAYDNSGFNLRGTTKSNAQGFYMFETIKPGKYLNGSQFRPSHIHFKITTPDFPTLTTQLYFEGDSDLENDAAASVTSGQFDATHRIVQLSKNGNGILEGTWDIVVSGDGITGINDLHTDKGVIYRAGPNPFSNQISIRYGVFRRAEVGLYAYNMQGRLVATLDQQTLSSGQYDAVWQPTSDLPAGHYFIALKINDLQVYYLKVVYTG